MGFHSGFMAHIPEKLRNLGLQYFMIVFDLGGWGRSSGMHSLGFGRRHHAFLTWCTLC
jgi:hypothetical protein